jgi:LmbE family N-acetylglucosaminyl deacetylase
MASLVFFHAHPDDESIATGGSMAKYAAAGHRVVLVVATDGRHGEVPDDLAEGETLADRRRRETDESARVLGVAAVHWLGYEDSGMTGWPQNDHPDSFYQAPLDEAAGRLAAILRAEGADVLTTYDWHGNYGHPDHIKVHHVGHRAAELAGTPEVFEATVNRDLVVRLIEEARTEGLDMGPAGDEEQFDPDDTDDGEPFGMPEESLTHAVDVRAFIDRKRASMACHASQITDSSFFLQMPPEAFAAAFGTEWYIRRGSPPGIAADELV